MRIESLTVALRPRTAWEAVELGTALVRRHASAIWKPWLLLTLPVFVLFNAMAWAIDSMWLAFVLMWWLKPAFDRIPLFVLSRAVFGDVPTTRQTLAAQRNWGLSWLPGYLSWRRLSPLRSLNLPVDFLEGARGRDARERRRALGAPVNGVTMLVTLACLLFQLAVFMGLVTLAIVLVPDAYLREVLGRAWEVVKQAPVWLGLLVNALAWIATSLIEPFYVGAGFGLYLNRRTEVEAWDIELALRRLRDRLLRGAAPVLLVFALGFAFAPGAVHAQDAGESQGSGSVGNQAGHPDDAEDEEAPRVTLQQVFGRVADGSGLRDGVNAQMTPQPAPTTTVSPGGGATGAAAGNGRALAGDGSLRRAVGKAYADPTVTPKRKVVSWKKRDAKKPDPEKAKIEPMLGWLGEIFATVGEYGLWFVVIVLIGALLATAPRWLAWFHGGFAREAREDEVRRDRADDPAPPLPDDIPSAIRRLWREGRQREALAMLYRASVDTMVARTQAVLVPGATEAEVLRVSRKLPQGEDRDAFARAVRTWQYAAYAHSFPEGDDFESLLADLASRFGWTATSPTRGEGSVPA